MYRTICLAAATSTLFCGLSSSWSSWHFLKVFDYIYLIFPLFPPLIKALIVEEPASEPREPHPANLVSLRTAAAALRDQIHRIEKEEEVKGTLNNRRTSGGSGSSSNLPGSTAGGQNSTANLKATEKPRKKLAEVEAQLVLASPSLVFQVSYCNV